MEGSVEGGGRRERGRKGGAELVLCVQDLLVLAQRHKEREMKRLNRQRQLFSLNTAMEKVRLKSHLTLCSPQGPSEEDWNTYQMQGVANDPRSRAKQAPPRNLL